MTWGVEVGGRIVAITATRSTTMSGFVFTAAGWFMPGEYRFVPVFQPMPGVYRRLERSDDS